MNWIKLNTTLPRSPKVLRAAALMGVDQHTALGLILDWLCWLDGVSTDGSTGLTAELIDQLFPVDSLSQKNVTSVTRCHKMSQTLVTIGWASIDENGNFHAAEFEKYNGENTKKRAEAAERQRKCRARKVSRKNVTTVTDSCDQIREENIYKKIDSYESTKTPLPESADDVLTFLAAQPNCGLRGEELLACAETFFNDFEAVGWTMRNQPVRNWHSAARSFLAKWQNNTSSRVAAAPRGKVTYRSETQQNYEL